MKSARTMAAGMAFLAALAMPGLAQAPGQDKTVVGTVVGVYLKLGPNAADMHAIEVRAADGMELPAWYYDKQDKNLGSYQRDDRVEVRYVTVAGRDGRNRNEILEIRKASPEAFAAAAVPKSPPPSATDYSALKAAVAAGKLAEARAMADAMAVAEGGYQLFGDRLRQAGLPLLALHCYTMALGGKPAPRGPAYTARRSMLLVYEGDFHPDLRKVADGDYKGSCIGYVGPVEVTVSVKDHRIVDVKVQSRESRPLTAQQAVPAGIIKKQGVRGVDVVTGATITSQAIMVGACNALKEAEK